MGLLPSISEPFPSVANFQTDYADQVLKVCETIWLNKLLRSENMQNKLFV